MDDTDTPIQPEEIDGLFARFAAVGPCALAVSGGSDSTALMVVFADWLRRNGEDAGRYPVLTVDHGLRAESAAEARTVAAAAQQLGYRHTTLVWQGPKPHAGIQAAARAARYRLMGDHLRTHGIRLLLTAHTRDDQAETLLMRLARGSGLDGLCAMAPITPLAGPHALGLDGGGGTVWIGRPLLDVPKACLRATLQARGIAWIEDPSNAAPVFERTRLRAARAQLDVLGLTPAMLSLSAVRLARARRAIERLVDRFCDPRDGAVRVDPCGLVGIDRARLRQAGEEIALRVLERAIAAAGGSGEPVPLGKLEAILPAVCDGPSATGRWTLARALITAQRTAVEVEREPGREPLPELTLEPGAAALWDGRFRVVAGAGLVGPVLVRALGESGLRDLRRRGLVKQGVPGAAEAVPAIWLDGRLVAVPPLDYWVPPCTSADLKAAFVGLGSPPGAAVPGATHPPAAR
jgi:tRNA(Ile)-lysidine synthase